MELLCEGTAFDNGYLELETDADLKSRMRENRTYGSVRGSRQAFHVSQIYRKECRDCLLDENFYSNHGLVILDAGSVTFGHDVFIGPLCGFHTSGHPVDFERRNQGLEYAYPIVVGDNVWFGAGVQVMPGVTIGSNVVIGSGSIVTKDIPSNSVAVGNPCKVIRRITDDDRKKSWDR
ncbi:MAG: sugar O-acetyltransferase [Lachnospiraceae bacterium]|nr:sugar O-acetyltransferase [Lachnospiraceae bacterium]